MKVLIVEDEVSLQCFLEHVLKDEFEEILIADNGKMALDMLAAMEDLPNLIIMDVLMPEMDGFELHGKCASVIKANTSPSSSSLALQIMMPSTAV